MQASEKLSEASERILKKPVQEAIESMRADLTKMQIVVVGDLAKAYTMAYMLEGMAEASGPPPAALLAKIATKLQELLFRCGVGAQLSELKDGIADSPEFAKAAANWESLLSAMLDGTSDLFKAVMEDPELSEEAQAQGRRFRAEEEAGKIKP